MHDKCTIIPFESPEFGEIRAIEQDGESWFVAKDVCRALEHSNTSQAVARLDDDEKANFKLGFRGGDTPCVNEAGMYQLVLGSRKPEAKAFKRWITHEVMPAIRKRGGYMATNQDETPEQVMARALLIAKDALDRKTAELERAQADKVLLEVANEEMKPKALFADAVSTSKQSILVGELAKVLKGNGVEGMGQNRLFAWMRDNGYLMKRGGHRNMPTQKSMELGLFEVKETSVTHSDGHVTISMTPKVTGKGQQYFVNKFLGDAEVVA